MLIWIEFLPFFSRGTTFPRSELLVGWAVFICKCGRNSLRCVFCSPPCYTWISQPIGNDHSWLGIVGGQPYNRIHYRYAHACPYKRRITIRNMRGTMGKSESSTPHTGRNVADNKLRSRDDSGERTRGKILYPSLLKTYLSSHFLPLPPIVNPFIYSYLHLNKLLVSEWG